MDKKVIVITGASGTGKTTISRYLEDTYNIPHVITHTTRLPRDGEVNGVDYYFETPESFEKNHYLERVEYSGNKYGSSVEGLEETWKKSDIASIVVDTKGAIAYQKKFGDAAIILFLKADPEEVADRLAKRGDEKARLLKRMASEENRRDFEIPKELYGNYYEIVNKDIKKTKDYVNQVIKSVK
ncbi:guanylate kinase [Companilactobacillus ginsenosidimutans]|uniref:Guanylate kinase n=1 Tax=Companilactobacillus ginsenosidimutans TaxID=1007676 RepID=A0A0H4QLK8_9LACO|nr:AAA family ATPase [Companilactobacillus ginsenosidimutans]AKP67593.1 guanylate kinase [Companilactobacillus ginsenosidimutans]